MPVSAPQQTRAEQKISPFEPRTLKGRVVWQLGLVQLLNWGVTFFLPGAFGPAIASDLGWSGQQVYAGLSLAMLIMALVSPFSGRLIGLYGGRRIMQVGTLINICGLLILAQATTSLGYFGAWAVLGLGMRLSLYDAAFATLADLLGPAARPSIVRVTLLGGLSSALFWPLGNELIGWLGWRPSLWVYALLSLASLWLLASLPARSVAPDVALNAAPLPVLDNAPRLGSGRQIGGRYGGRFGGRIGSYKVLYASSVATLAFISAGLSVHLPGVLMEFGLPVGLAALIGIGQTCSRLADMSLSRKLPALRLNVWMSCALPLCFAVGLGLHSLALAVVFIFSYGLLNGLATLLRANLPFELFEPRDYAQLLGKLVAPSFFFSAIAPWFYACVRDRFGSLAIVVLSLMLSLVVTWVALAMNARHLRSAQAESAGTGASAPGVATRDVSTPNVSTPDVSTRGAPI